MSDQQKKIQTRSTVKTTHKVNQPTTAFNPQHRSTELHSDSDQESNPFARSFTTPRSPEREIRKNIEEKAVSSRLKNKPEELNIKKILQEKEEITSAPTTIERQANRGRFASRRSSNTSERSEEETLTIPQLNTMDVTISTSLANPKTPVVPKFLCPPTFDPSSGNAVAFMKNYERTAAANSWDNNLKINYLSTFLEGAAELWFNHYKNAHQNQEKTWDNIKGDFIKEFSGMDVKRVLEKKLYETKQRPTQSIRAYFYELQTLFGDYDPNYNVEVQKIF